MRLLVTRHLSTTHTDSAVGSDPTNIMRWSARVCSERQQVRHYVLAEHSHVDSSRVSRALWQQEAVALIFKNNRGIHQVYFKYKHYTSDIVRHTGCRPPYWFASTSGSSHNVSGPLPGSTSAILWKPSWVLTACILYNNVCTFIFSSSLSSSLIYQGQPSIKATHLSRSPQAVATCRSRPTPGEGEGR